jgi:hypothetical protein
MPTQALIRKLSRTELEEQIVRLQAEGLFDVISYEALLLVRCKSTDGAKTLQMLCDIDAAKDVK